MAGRPRNIDRDKVLDAAEAVLAQGGAATLSFDAVAKAAGVTKGGVQYCFGTKDNLVRSLISRWADAFDREVDARAGADAAPRHRVRAHLAVTRDYDETLKARTAVVLTAMLQSPEDLAMSRAWYRERLDRLDMDDDGDRKTALAFMAGEAVFLLQTLGFLDPDDARCTRILDEALALVPPDGKPSK